MNRVIRRSQWTTTFLLLLAFTLRGVNLLRLPPGLARDEALNADIAELIRAGNHAIVFREGFGHEPLYHYIGALFQALIGDHALSIRLPSLLLGVVLVALVLRMGQRELGWSLGFLAAAALAVAWWGITFSRVGLRPISLPVLLLLVLYTWRRPYLAGFWLGLSLYTYTAARILPLLPLVDIIFTVLFVRVPAERRQRLQRSATILLISLVIAAPLFWALQTNPELNERLGQLAGPLTALGDGNAAPLLRNLAASLTTFGFTNLATTSYALDSAPLLPLLPSLLLFVGLSRALWLARERQLMGLLAFGWLLLLLPGAASAESPSAIRMIGALPLTMLLIAVGVAALSQQLTINATRCVVLPIVMLAVLFPLIRQTALDGFSDWTRLPETRQKYQSIWLDIGDDIRATQPENIVVADSWYEPVKADSLWRGVGRKLPIRWVYNSSALVFPSDGGTLYVPEFAPLDPALYTAAQNYLVLNTRSSNTPAYARYSLTPPAMSIELVNFDQLLRLQALHQLPDGSWLSRWLVQNKLPSDLAFFVHLVADSDQPLAQHDGLFAAPDTLHAGDIIWQLHAPEGSSDQATHIRIGAYTRNNGQRLATENGATYYQLNLEETMEDRPQTMDRSQRNVLHCSLFTDYCSLPTVH